LYSEEVDDLFQSLPPEELARKEASKALCDEAADMIRNGTRRLHDRVKEMADCVKGLSSAPVFAPCRLASVIHEVFQTLRMLAKDKGIDLKADGLDALPELMADERRLYNAFYNLVNNAIPETPAGGSISVQGRWSPASPHLNVAVADTGRGMPAHVRERLFSSRAVSTKKGGTGLGTKIVKDVVDAHRGKIRVTSTPGEGTTFHLELPLNPTA
jgi:signal transduction histidine kinase